MATVFVEPRPKGRREGTQIEDYVLEFADGEMAGEVAYQTQAEAIKTARGMGYDPMVARVRNTDKGNAAHWRAA